MSVANENETVNEEYILGDVFGWCACHISAAGSPIFYVDKINKFLNKLQMVFYFSLVKVCRSLHGVTIVKNRSINSWNYLLAISHYDVLGVSRTATKKEIRSAYLQKTKELHPDNNLNDDSLHERFTQVTQAYQILSNEDLRNSYNVDPHNTSRDKMRQNNQKTKQHSTTNANPFGEYNNNASDWEWDEETKRRMYDEFYATTYPEYLKQMKKEWANRRRKNRIYVLLILAVTLSFSVLNFSRVWMYHQDYRGRSDKHTTENAAFLNNRKTGYRAYINRISPSNVERDKEDNS